MISCLHAYVLLLKFTSDKGQKMPELEKIDFLRTQPSE